MCYSSGSFDCNSVRPNWSAHRPLEDQTNLSGGSKEAAFVGITPNYNGGVVLLNQLIKRTYIRYPFKYLSDTHVVADTTSAVNEELISSIPNRSSAKISTTVPPGNDNPETAED